MQQPFAINRIGTLTIVLLFIAATVHAQPGRARQSVARPPVSTSGCLPTAVDLRAITRDVRAANPTDTDAFLRALDRAAGVDFTAMEPTRNGDVRLLSVDGIVVTLTPRYGLYRLALSEQIRKMEPIESTPIIDGHAVIVTPTTMDAPDIVKVALQRNGVIVQPIESSLASKVFQNRMGASTTKHAGMVLFPCSAFAPDSIVTVTLIPDVGENISKTLTLGVLRALR